MTDTILEVDKEHFSESIGTDNGAKWSDVLYKGLYTVWKSLYTV